jgi:hypothetical protein
MSKPVPHHLPVTPARNSQKSNTPGVQASRRSFPDFEFDEEEDEYQGTNPLLDVDFSDLEFDTQDEFSYQEEDDLDLDDNEDQDLEDEEE